MATGNGVLVRLTWFALGCLLSAVVLLGLDGQARAAGDGNMLAVSPAPVLVDGAPGCSSVTSIGRALTSASEKTVQLPSTPFGVASTRDGRWSFVDETGRPGPRQGSVAVLSDSGPWPQIVRTIGVSSSPLQGAALTANDRYLLLASASGAVVVDARRAETGAKRAVLGDLTIKDQVTSGPIEVTSSPDGRYVFVSDEYSDEIAVFDLAKALRTGFRGSRLVGTIPVGEAVVGLAIAPDGQRLYATSEAFPGHELGGLSVISVARAERDPAHSVIANVITGCQPVRVAVSPDGQTVWVTARGSDALLGFAADKLTTDPTRALVTDVRVGEAPVGLAVSRDGRQIIVADSNRFDVPGANSDLTIIDADRTGNDRLSVVGHVAAGLFPRDVSLDPAGVLIATDYGSDQITLLNTTQLGSAERSLSPG